MTVLAGPDIALNVAQDTPKKCVADMTMVVTTTYLKGLLHAHQRTKIDMSDRLRR